jgi:hypothetical protein
MDTDVFDVSWTLVVGTTRTTHDFSELAGALRQPSLLKITEGDTAVEAWVADKTLAVLEGRAGDVASGIRRRASTAQLTKTKRKNADACATYLTNKTPYLDYPTALAAGWPIATGIIEGTCRYLVADRMDITGARWSVEGAEAVLKLRAVRSNGDFDDYWTHHLDHERQRVHESPYANGDIPLAA